MIAEWKPLFAGAEAERILAIVVELADAIQTRLGDLSDRDFDPFITLLYAHLGRLPGMERYSSFADRLFDAVSESVESRAHSPSLYGGLAGDLWLEAYLDNTFREAAEEAPPDAASDEVTLLDYLAETLAVPLGAINPELIYGLAGMGVACLERLPDPRAEECLRAIVRHAAALAEPTPSGMRWLTRPEWLNTEQARRYPGGWYNLGVSHGIPGLAVVLAKIAAAGVEVEQATALATGAFSWMLEQRMDDGRWPAVLGPPQIDGPPETIRSLRWCYGVFGVGSALLAAGRALSRPAWIREGLSALALCLESKTPEDAGVPNAMLCHGAASCVHLYNRAFQSTNDPAFAAAAKHWLNIAIEMYRADDRKDRIDWLEGTAGLALVLLAAIEAREPSWDRLLAIS